MYKIEKNILFPEGPRSLLYPFREMEIGDSFLFLLKRLSVAQLVQQSPVSPKKILSINFRSEK